MENNVKKYFKGMIAGIIAAAAAVAFLVGFLVNGASAGKAVAADNNNTVAASADTTEDKQETIVDSAGNEFVIPLDVDSVINLNKNATDMLTALGKSDIVTGKSDDTKYPASASSLKSYGTSEKPDTENIIAANPGAVIAPVSFKNSTDYTKLTEAGIKVVCLNLDDADTAVEETAKLGLLFDSFDKANDFVTDMENIKSLIQGKIAGESEAKVYWEKNENYTSINKSSNENKILKLASSKSITSDKAEAEVKADAEYLKAENPSAIVKTSDYDKNVLTLEREDLKEAEEVVEEIKKRSGLDSVSAVKDNKIVVLSDRIVNTPLGSAIAPLYIAKTAFPDKMQDVTPGQYLNEFLDKYWGSNFKGALAYAGDVSIDENTNSNVVASGSSSGTSLLSSLASTSANTGTSLRDSLVSTSSSGSARDNLLSKAGSDSGSTSGNTSTNTNSNTGKNVTKTDDGKVDASTGDGKKQVIEDSTGTKIVVDDNTNSGETAIKRCIVFNSSVYEMIKIFGGKDTVIGVADSLAQSSDFPELANKKTFGKWNAPDAEAIIEANPDVVFAYANYGQEALQKVRNAGIAVVSLNLYIPSEIDEEIITLGKLFGNSKLAEEWNKDVHEIQDIIAGRTKYLSKARCYWETYTDYSSVADGSGGAELLNLAGVYNLYDSASAAAYPKVSDEWVIQKNPDVVVKVCSSTVTSPTYCMGTTVTNYSLARAVYSKIASRTGWSEISAVQNEKILLLHSKVGTTAFGCAVAPLYIAKVAYPDKFADVDADSYARAFYKKYWGTDLTGTWRFSYQKLN